MYLCILDGNGQVVYDQNLAADPDAFLQAVAPFRDGLVVGCECLFCWYWLADLCAREQIAFVLGHALYMKAIHGGKSKNDRLDAAKIARLLRGGTLPQAYVYPAGLRATRDLLRRRMYLVHKRAAAIAHVQNTNSQYNLAPFGQQLAYAANREALRVAERFTDPSARRMIDIDLALIDRYDALLGDVELYLTRAAKVDDVNTFHRLRSVPGVGKILALVLLYEIHDIRRFPGVGNFLSYARLVRGAPESGGKKLGSGGKKIGNAHLRWAFAEAACLFVRQSERAKRWLRRQEEKRGKGKALAVLAAKLGRAASAEPAHSPGAFSSSSGVASQTLIVRSSPPEARRRPSRLKATARTASVWPRNASSSRPAASHSRTTPSSPADASRPPGP
jgi:transposase